MAHKVKPKKTDKPEDPLKMEIAELGLLEKVREHGWKPSQRIW